MSENSFAQAFSTAVTDRGLTLDRLHDRLVQAGVPVSVATLSYWQSGRSRPERRSSLQALPVLEGILGLAPGHLTRALPKPRPRGRAAAASRNRSYQMAAMLAAGELVQSVFDEWGIGRSGSLTRFSIQDRMAVTVDRADGPISTRLVQRADVDGIESFPVVYVQDMGLDLPPPPQQPGERDVVWSDGGIVPLTACELGRVERRDDLHLLVAELRFPRPLARGEVVMTEHLLIPKPSSRESDRLQRAIPAPLRELVLEAHFDPDDPPTRAFRYRREHAEGPETESSEIAIHGSGIQTVFLDLQAGATAGLRWTWD